MSINAESAARFSSQGDGVALNFDYLAPLTSAADLHVYFETIATGAIAEQMAGFTVTDMGTIIGGPEDWELGARVTFIAAPPATVNVVREGDTAATQGENFAQYSGFPAERATKALDRAAIRAQQQKWRYENLTLRFPPGWTGSIDPLPPLIPNSVLGIDANGNPFWAGSPEPASAAIAPLIQAATVAAFRDLAGIPWRNFVTDFGGKGDDATNNDAALAAAYAWANANGGTLYFPGPGVAGGGIYRSNAHPTITGDGVTILGDGPGMRYTDQNAGPAAGGHGTVFRNIHATSDTLTVDRTATNTVVRGIGFWPVPYRTGGFEIVDAGYNSLVEDIAIVYTNGAIKCAGGANGSTYRRIRIVGIWGQYIVLTRGSSPALADWAQGLVFDDVVYYSPWPIADPVNATTTAAWAPNTVYGVGAVTFANNSIWQATVGGMSAAAGTGPSRPAYAFAGAPTSQLVVDNAVTWRLVEHAFSSCLCLDSNTVDVVVKNSQLLSAAAGVLLNNTLGSGIVPQYVKIVDTLIDHTVQDCVQANVGYEITLQNTDLHYSALGRGITGAGGFTGGITIEGGHIWANALDGIQLPPIANAGVTIMGTRINANGVKTANTYSAIAVPAATTKYKIIGCDLGADPSGAGTQKYGIDQGAGNDHYVIADNIALGNGTAGYNLVSGRDKVSRLFENNDGTVVGVTVGAAYERATLGAPSDVSVFYLNRLINGTFRLFQRQAPGTPTARTDDTYGPDRWNILTETAAINCERLATPFDGARNAVRLTQNQAAAQRFGIEQIVEGAGSIDLRSQAVTLWGRARCSAATTLRYAILEWTGGEDAVTSDVVNNWASGAYTAGNFFLGANLTVTAVGSIALAANTWTDIPKLTATLGGALTNLIALFWTEAQQAQNVTLDLANVGLVRGSEAPAIYTPRPITEELALAQRYYQKSFALDTAPAQNAGEVDNAYQCQQIAGAAGALRGHFDSFPVAMRATPTITTFNPSAANAQMRNTEANADCSATAAIQSYRGIRIGATTAAGSNAAQTNRCHWTADAEL